VRLSFLCVCSALIAAGCAQPLRPAKFADVSIDQLRADPAAWIGRPVEVAGVVDTQGADSTLNENCAGNAESILVRWTGVPGFRPSDDGTKVRIRGVFRTAEANKQPPPGEMAGGDAASAMANRASLQDVSIVWRVPADVPGCRA